MGIWRVLVLCVLLVCSCNGSEASIQRSLVRQAITPRGDGYVDLDPKYDRMDEVSKACAPFLSSASKLRLTKGEKIAMMDSLSFYQGEWYQIGGKSPLMPYIPDEYVSGSRWSKRMRRDRDSFLFNLASFMLSGVNSSSLIENSVGVYGVLDVDIRRRTRHTSNIFWLRNARGVPSFRLLPGVSQLSIGFQGLYFESDEMGGEKIMCLLGDAKLPSRSDNPSNPWPWAKVSNSSPSEPPFSHDDQILLVLRYPITVSIPNVAVRGELKSLNPVTDDKYFDEVRLVAISNEVNDNYQFSSREVPGGACDPYPYADSLLDGHIDMYKGSDFCGMLNSEILRGRAWTFVPNWRCRRSHEYCRQLGPFKMDKATEATNGTFIGAQLLMQNVQCEVKFVKPNDTEARIFAVFRARLISGLSSTTLVAEGKWRSSSGQLCMVACVMTFDSAENACDSRICLYFPVSLSITQRSLLFGSISSIKAGEAAYFPLSFQREVFATDFRDRASSELRYRYSVLGSLKTDEPSDLSAAVKKTLVKYPKLEESVDYMSSLDLLAQDLTFFGSLHDTNLSSWNTSDYVEMTVLALGPLLGQPLRMYRFNSSGSRKWGDNSYTNRSHYYTKAASADQRPLLNVSAILAFNGDTYTNLMPLSLEGLYDYRTGKMHLIGCRDIRHFLETPFDSKTLKAGFDCLIEVNVSYPPTRLQWLAKQGAEISISSKRDVHDPLYFHPIELETSPISYSQQRKDKLSRIGIKGVLRLLTLSVAVFIIRSQLLHIRKTSVVDSVPYTSLVMLGVQVLGYGIPLILDTEAYLSKNSQSYDQSRYIMVLGNFIWNTKSQPLRKVYYVGMTMVTLLPHLYDIFCPLPNPYWREEEKFFTESFDIVISWMALLLLVIVHLQQTYSFLIDGSTAWPLSVLPVGSRGYEKVSSDVPESELTTNVDGRHLGKETA
ncbi:hypothetical protein AKJ16_DCAP23560 [Drosera capensis]